MNVAYLIFSWLAVAISGIGITMGIAALLWLAWVGACELREMFRRRAHE